MLPQDTAFPSRESKIGQLCICHGILLTYASFHCRSLSNPANPAQEMRQAAHLLITKAREFLSLNTRPGVHVSSGIFSFSSPN